MLQAPSSLRDRLRRQRARLRPPPRMSLSEWADRNFYLSAESAAEPGRWTTFPYQRGILDAIGDQGVERVTWQKAARVGATKCMNVAIAYYMAHDPCPILVVQPTVEDAQGYSKEEIAPMLRDCPMLAAIVAGPTTRVSESTILHKSYPGGVLSMVGANSGRGFRRVSRRAVFLDEVDGYPPSAGGEGDPVQLAIRRTEFYWNRKIVACSTPLIEGTSRIQQLFEAGDRRRFHVPCPSCGHMEYLVFREGERGHFMKWPDGQPEEAHFVCRANGCIIEHRDKIPMLERGEWRAEGEFHGHASFHLWSAYSYSPNATWGQIAQEFLEAKRAGPEKLKTFVNTSLGETWQERGDAPDWERLFLRREPYPIAQVPARVRFLTAGVDVQRDRFVVEVVGWAETKENWSIDAFDILGDTSDPATWSKLDELVGRFYVRSGGGEPMPTSLTAIDSGFQTQQVYNWVRRHQGRAIAVKGSKSERRIIGSPSIVDIAINGRKIRRGARVWPVGTDIAKSELYGWLRLRVEEGLPPPSGFCHFPEYGEQYFKQLTAEVMVTTVRRNGAVVMEWHVLPNRQNHFLDCRIYARAAASVLGLDRFVAPAPAAAARAPSSDATAQPEPARPAKPRAQPAPARPGGWLGPRRPRPGGWLGKRR
jgi:phage terminase large subunit GpA-like protein